MRELGYKSLILRVRNISFNKMAAFQDKVVWITGASSGIGEALAYAFAQQGAKLVLSARRKEVLAQVAKQTNLPDCRVLILPIDMTQTKHHQNRKQGVAREVKLKFLGRNECFLLNPEQIKLYD